MPALKLDRYIFALVLLLLLVGFDAQAQTAAQPSPRAGVIPLK